jgi:RNA polymerase subunit RPABC4/transcription elongation factor Spt4
MHLPFVPINQHQTEPVFCPICGSRLEREWREEAFDQLLETASCPKCNVEAQEDRESATVYGLPSAREKLVRKLYARLEKGDPL